jgi:predicted ester cyclase
MMEVTTYHIGLSAFSGPRGESFEIGRNERQRGTNMATTQARNKERIRDYLETLNDHDFDAALEIYTDDYTTTITHPTREEEELDVDGLAELWSGYVEAFPDLRAEVHEMAADGDWVLVRVEFSGTHRGEFWGIEPTANEVEMQEHISYRFEDGEVVETHTTGDGLGLLRQLGVDLPIEN